LEKSKKNLFREIRAKKVCSKMGNATKGPQQNRLCHSGRVIKPCTHRKMAWHKLKANLFNKIG